jgi:hypothetical protein
VQTFLHWVRSEQEFCEVSSHNSVSISIAWKVMKPGSYMLSLLTVSEFADGRQVLTLNVQLKLLKGTVHLERPNDV